MHADSKDKFKGSTTPGVPRVRDEDDTPGHEASAPFDQSFGVAKQQPGTASLLYNTVGYHSYAKKYGSFPAHTEALSSFYSRVKARYFNISVQTPCLNVYTRLLRKFQGPLKLFSSNKVVVSPRPLDRHGSSWVATELAIELLTKNSM